MKTFSTKFNACNIYILLWVLYNLQGIIFPSGTLLSQLLLFTILLMSLVAFLKTALNREKPNIFKGLNALMIVFTIYGLLHIMFGETIVHIEAEYTTYGFLKAIYSSLLPIYTFYYYAIKGQLSIKSLRFWVFVFVLVAIAQYYRNQRLLLREMELLGSDREDFTNNIGYLFLSLLPAMVVFYNKPIVQYLGLSVCLLFMIMSMKRGVILTAAVVFVYFFASTLKMSKRRKVFGYIILSMAIAFVGWFFISTTMLNNDYFVFRVQETLQSNSSGRDTLYAFFWDEYMNHSTYLEQLFGHGAWATVRIGPNFAHNDWLELLINQGLCSVFIYLYFWIQFIVTINNSRYGAKARQVMIMVFIIALMKSFFSAGYSDMSVYSNCVLGFALAGGFDLDGLKN